MSAAIPIASVDSTAGARVVIVGGGLAGGLIALALADAGRGATVCLVEQGARLGGNHTWSFHETDLGAEERALVTPLVEREWPRQLVRFPGHQRRLDRGYCSISSDRFAAVLTERLQSAGADLRFGRRVSSMGPAAIRLDNEEICQGDVVIDARGPDIADGGAIDGAGVDFGAGVAFAAGVAFQKFVGLEVELTSDGPWRDPVLMDATVAQIDGYRFIYVLPFTSRRVLVEDTMYSSAPDLNVAEVEDRVLAYVAGAGASVGRVLRREAGVLPLPLREQSAPAAAAQSGAALAVGYRGGFFHPVTGYSLPLAARVAVAVAQAWTAEEIRLAVKEISRQLLPQQRFGQLLNRLMFQAMSPASRWNALDRFYRLPAPTIERFYASRTTAWDRARVFLGRPPRGISWRHLLFGTQKEKS